MKKYVNILILYLTHTYLLTRLLDCGTTGLLTLGDCARKAWVIGLSQAFSWGGGGGLLLTITTASVIKNNQKWN